MRGLKHNRKNRLELFQELIETSINEKSAEGQLGNNECRNSNRNVK